MQFSVWNYVKTVRITSYNVCYTKLLRCIYLGENQLEALCNVKTKNELIGDVIGLLQSPMKNVISGLQSGGNTIHGILKTLGDK